jgi:hypothetical protein
MIRSFNILRRSTNAFLLEKPTIQIALPSGVLVGPAMTA